MVKHEKFSCGEIMFGIVGLRLKSLQKDTSQLS